MSDPHNEHETGIKTPKQLIAVILASFLVPIVCIVLLVQFVVSGNKVGAGSNGQTAEAISARIKPIADIGYSFKDVNAPRVLMAGADVYKSTCQACHGAGVAGAPKVGDAGSWAARIAEGYDTLLKHAIEGLRAMPARGGNPDLDDAEVGRAIVFMANQSGAKFKEPEVKTPAAAPAAASAQGQAPVAPAAASAAASAASTSPAAPAPASPTTATPAPAAAPAVAPAAASATAPAPAAAPMNAPAPAASAAGKKGG